VRVRTSEPPCWMATAAWDLQPCTAYREKRVVSSLASATTARTPGWGRRRRGRGAGGARRAALPAHCRLHWHWQQRTSEPARPAGGASTQGPRCSQCAICDSYMSMQEQGGVRGEHSTEEALARHGADWRLATGPPPQQDPANHEARDASGAEVTPLRSPSNPRNQRAFHCM